MNKKIIHISSKDASIMRTHMKDEFHMKECLKGKRVHKNEKRYSRKEKHKSRYYE